MARVHFFENIFKIPENKEKISLTEKTYFIVQNTEEKNTQKYNKYVLFIKYIQIYIYITFTAPVNYCPFKSSHFDKILWHFCDTFCHMSRMSLYAQELPLIRAAVFIKRKKDRSIFFKVFESGLD